MTCIVIGHVPADAEAAQELALQLRTHAAITVAIDALSPPLSFGSDIAVALLWSERAIGSDNAFASLLQRNLNPTFIIPLDTTPIGPRVSDFNLFVLHTGADEASVAHAVKIARFAPNSAGRGVRPNAPMRGEAPRLAVRRPVAMQRPAGSIEPQPVGKRHYAGIFAGGAARGFAGSMATLGLGAVVAVGLQERAGLLSVSQADARGLEDAHDRAYVEQAGATASPDDEIFAPFATSEQVQILDHETLEAQAATLRAIATAQRVAIEQHLQSASGELDSARGRTFGVVDQLEAIATQNPIAMSPIPEIPAPKLFSGPEADRDLQAGVKAPEQAASLTMLDLQPVSSDAVAPNASAPVNFLSDI
jgi:hypothetical protein